MANGFRRSLFGFRRKDVIAYLEQIDVDYRDGLSKAESGTSALEKKNIALADEIKELNTRCDELAAERSALIDQKEMVAREKEAIACDLSELVEINANLELKLKEREEKAEAEKQELCEKLAEAEKQIVMHTDKLSEYEKLIAEREVLTANATRRAEQADAYLAQKSEQTDYLRHEVEKLKEEVAKLKEELEKEKHKTPSVTPEKKRKDAVSAILSYVRKR